MHVKRLVSTFILLAALAFCTHCGRGGNKAVDDFDLQEAEAKTTPAASPAEAGRPTGDPVCLDTNTTAEKWSAQAEQLLEDGWASYLDGAEGGRFIWAVAEKASFRFWIDAPEKGGVLTLICWAPEGGNKPPQKIKIEANGKPVGEVTMADGSNTFNVDVPAEALQKGNNRFQLDFAKVVVPKELGTANDDRHLAAGFRLIVFKAKEAAAATAPVPAAAPAK